MRSGQFSPWHSWESRGEVAGIALPGVYAVALSATSLAGTEFSLRSEIIYVGMTNAVAGLRGRLRQFDATMKGKRGHGGADRVRYKHQTYSRFAKQAYVSVAPFSCDVQSNRPDDLRVMGEVAKCEYDCFARIVEKFGNLPEFNQKKGSPKYSLTFGRKGIRRDAS